MLSLEFFIAWRYLKARRRGVFTLLTSIIGIGGITLGDASLIITLGVMSGFHRDIREKILGFQPHIVILKEGIRPFTEFNGVMNRIKTHPEVEASAPFVYGQGILRRGNSTVGCVIKGVDWPRETTLVGINNKITEGNVGPDGLGPDDIVLGRELANSLGAVVGREVIMMSPGSAGLIPKMKKFTVKAVFYAGMYEYDSNLAYVSLKTGQDIFNMDTAVNGIGVKIRNWEKSDVLEDYLQKALSYPYWIRSWQNMNKNLFAALKLEKLMMFIILTLIIVVAAFNIISNLLLLTVEKSREIGILSALGLKRIEIGKIFFIEGMIIGMSGIFTGGLLGIGLSLLLKKYQFIHLPPDVYYLSTLPVKLLPGDILSVMGATFLITLLSIIYPAYQATKLDPLDAIRYG